MKPMPLLRLVGALVFAAVAAFGLTAALRARSESPAAAPATASREPPPAAGPAPVAPSSLPASPVTRSSSSLLPSGMTGTAAAQYLPQNYEEARRQVEAAVAAHPNDFGRRMAAAGFYMNANDHRAAMPHLWAATRLTRRVFPWIALGDAATLTAQFPLAHRAYDRAAKIDPGNAFMIRGKAQLLIAEQKYQQAGTLLTSWLKRYPDNVHIRAELGTLYLLRNHPAKAIEVLEPAVKQHPTLAYLHALLGDACARNLHVERGISEMKEAVRIDPTMADAWGKIALYEVNLARYAEAREPLERAIALEPMESHYYSTMGDSYMLERQDDEYFTKGAQYYRQALNLDPKNDKALYSYGMALMRRARREDLPVAASLFERLVKINPNDMNAHYKLAEAYRALGKTAQARAHQAKFLDLYARGRHQTRSSYLAMSYRDTPEVHVKLGREAMAHRDYALAAREFQFALQRDRMLKEAREGLLAAQKHMGQTAGAQAPTP